MKKTICISVIVLFVTLNMYSQELYEKKNMWGVSYGANVYYPRNKTFTTGSYDDYYKRYLVYYYKPQSTIGHFFEISKNYLAKSINNFNKLFLVPSVGIKQVKYYAPYEYYLSSNGYQSNINGSGKSDIKYLATDIGLKIKHIVLFKNNSSLFYFSTINFCFDIPNSLKRKRNNRNFLLYTSTDFGLGYSFNFNSFHFSLFVKHEIIGKSNYLELYSQMYNNMQFGVLFNF